MLSILTAKVKECLKMRKGLNLIVTVGNDMRMDDGVGSFIFSKLKSKKNLQIINAAYRPENIIEEVINMKPVYILFIDAADFGGCPGEVRVIDRVEIPSFTLSTHQIPLNLVADIIEAETRASVCMLGIQIKNAGFGEGLSEEVKKSAERIIRIIHRL